MTTRVKGSVWNLAENIPGYTGYTNKIDALNKGHYSGVLPVDASTSIQVAYTTFHMFISSNRYKVQLVVTEEGESLYGIGRRSANVSYVDGVITIVNDGTSSLTYEAVIIQALT